MAQANIKFPHGLKSWLRQQADVNCRSFNSEVIFRLELSRRKDEGLHRANGQAFCVTPQPVKVSGDSHEES